MGNHPKECVWSIISSMRYRHMDLEIYGPLLPPHLLHKAQVSVRLQQGDPQPGHPLIFQARMRISRVQALLHLPLEGVKSAVPLLVSQSE